MKNGGYIFQIGYSATWMEMCRWWVVFPCAYCPCPSWGEDEVVEPLEESMPVEFMYLLSEYLGWAIAVHFVKSNKLQLLWWWYKKLMLRVVGGVPMEYSAYFLDIVEAPESYWCCNHSGKWRALHHPRCLWLVDQGKVLVCQKVNSSLQTIQHQIQRSPCRYHLFCL